MRSSWRAGGCAFVVLAVLLGAGCGGDGVEPRQWARTVCQALAPWTSQIDSLTKQTQQEMAKATSPQQTKTTLLDLLGGAERASEAARVKVEKAGVPDVEDGAKLAGEFVSALTRTRDVYGRARTGIAALDTADAKAFYDGVVAVMDRLNTDYGQSGVNTDKLSSPDLQAAFNAEPECR